jgi:hypothetical protein
MIVYARADTSRKPKFQVTTTIERHDGQLTVRKRPLQPSSHEHLKSIVSNYERLKNARLPFRVEAPKLEGDAVELTYHNGETLDAKFSNLIFGGDIEGACKVLDELVKKIKNLAQTDTIATDNLEYTKVFGPAFSGKQACLSLGYLDYNLDNLIEKDGQWLLIDYEWLFTFPLPTNLVVARCIINALWRVNDYFLLRSSGEHPIVSINDRVFTSPALYKKYQTYLDMMPQVLQSEDYFNNYVRGGTYPKKYELTVTEINEPTFPGLAVQLDASKRVLADREMHFNNLIKEHEHAVEQLRTAIARVQELESSPIKKAARKARKVIRRHIKRRND